MRRLGWAFVAVMLVAAGPHGDLCRPAYCLDFELRGPLRQYTPQAGDIIFFNYEDSVFWKFAFKMAFSGPPDHSGVVVQMPDGTFGVLESGPDDSLRVETCLLAPRLAFHHCNRGRVWVRRRITPLTAEQSSRLTEFAISERHKEYAYWRLLGQGTWMRSRGPIKIAWRGKPKGPHESYFCSEVVLEALVYAGALCPVTTRPSATYPEDFFFDRSRNPYINKHLNLSCTWEPPARWITDDCPACKEYKGSSKEPNPKAIPAHPYFEGAK